MTISSPAYPDASPTLQSALTVCNTTPAEDGFIMPGEFEAHAGCIMIWPCRPGSWGRDPRAAREAFRNVIASVAHSEKVFVAANKQSVESALDMLFDGNTSAGSVCESWRWDKAAPYETEDGAWRANVEVFAMDSDDAWARDIAPTFVVKRTDADSQARGVNWAFNAWGGNIDGAYADWTADDAFAKKFCERYSYAMYDAAPFVLEGGAIASDGEGTLIVTESCLLSAGRNPNLSKTEIEDKLTSYTGAQKVLWLPCGILNDETNGHVDNICAFLRPAEVVLAWTDDKSDPQYPLSVACLRTLESMTDAHGRQLVVHKLPIPDIPVRFTETYVSNLAFDKDEITREVGERMPASYVNFYFANDAIIVPMFGDKNEKSDARAISLMRKWCPERTIYPVDAREILVGGGNIHCITQQIPAVDAGGATPTAYTEER